MGHSVEIVTDGPTILLSGDVDVRTTMEVRTAIYERLDGYDEDVVVDLTEVTSIDVTALKVLAAATRQAARSGQHLTLRGCGPAVRRLLHLSHLIRLVEVERAGIGA